MEERKGGQQVAVYVENIPKAMSWQGLWFAFARHGNVVGAFIANRRSRAGKKIGFVRFDNRTDALRAITRLNGFRLYGYILKVALAKIKGKRSVDCRNIEDGAEKPERFQRVVQVNQDIEDKEKEDFQKEKPVEENFTKPSKVEHVVVAASDDSTGDPLQKKRKIVEADKVKQEVENLSDSSTEESGRSSPELSRSMREQIIGVGDHNCFGNEQIDNNNFSGAESSRQLDGKVSLGEGKVEPGRSLEKEQIRNLRVEKFSEEGSKKGFKKIILNSEVIGGSGPGTRDPKVEKDDDSFEAFSDSVSARIDEDVRNIGLPNKLGSQKEIDHNLVAEAGLIEFNKNRSKVKESLCVEGAGIEEVESGLGLEGTKSDVEQADVFPDMEF
ncbi:hypothetical protein V6N11_056694 [Hibiscus sabdariffa]|uniref:RRM domain-containing protein n=1 Tax=Hibiscus sabdariffa TaxID=183260 RepID=A0ABR2T4L5_9ROSI